jgi:DNA-directed RNA polymerase sigma subunit (sigma70/sigma32)
MTAAINSEYHMTYSEIAEVLGVSRQRVRQIEQDAMRKLLQDDDYKAWAEFSSSSESRDLDQLLFF